MASIQHTIDIDIPAHALYQQLSQFENYPQFFDNVEKVEQIDATRLHWTTKMANRPVEWDAEITAQESNRCIAWQDLNGMGNSGRVEVEALGPQSSRVIVTLEAEPGQFPGITPGDTKDEMVRQLSRNLESLKQLAEANSGQSLDQDNKVPATSISGSPTELLEDEPNEGGPGAYAESGAFDTDAQNNTSPEGTGLSERGFATSDRSTTGNRPS